MKPGYVGLIVGIALWPLAAQAAEHGGDTMEHGGSTMEHGGAPMATTEPAAPAAAPVAAVAEPSPEDIRSAIRTHITDVVGEEGAFTIEDETTGAVRTLELVQVHERVGKIGDAYYSCTDMKDTTSGELLDLDFDVVQDGTELAVVDTRIHKVGGQERYTYDADSNRIPPTSGN